MKQWLLCLALVLIFQTIFVAEGLAKKGEMVDMPHDPFSDQDIRSQFPRETGRPVIVLVDSVPVESNPVVDQRGRFTNNPAPKKVKLSEEQEADEPQELPLSDLE